jgi:hypothetical protein
MSFTIICNSSLINSMNLMNLQEILKIFIVSHNFMVKVSLYGPYKNSNFTEMKLNKYITIFIIIQEIVLN